MAEVLGRVGMIMENRQRKISPAMYVILGLIISALLGLVENRLLLDKPLQYRENMLWKYTILFYAITMTFVFWVFFVKTYVPIFINLIKFMSINIFLSFPYFVALILTETISIKAVLTILPAQAMFLAVVFIWHVATEIDPELKKNTAKITIKSLIIGAVFFFLAGFLLLPELIGLSIGGFAILCYNLLILRQAQKKCHDVRW